MVDRVGDVCGCSGDVYLYECLSDWKTMTGRRPDSVLPWVRQGVAGLSCRCLPGSCDDVVARR